MLLRAKISKGGKISIPSIYRKKLQFKDGEEVLFDMKNDTLVISSLRCVLQKSRQLVNQYHPTDESLVDKLIAERREEAQYE
jgi:bifunctional DNA-binding transcriptional regulator/antitoxin component of YhaV-PrlF toxin-antitoxin module